jgi:hypothetical protein
MAHPRRRDRVFGGRRHYRHQHGPPAKRVTNGYAGSHMRVPDEALRLIEAVVGATPPVRQDGWLG